MALTDTLQYHILERMDNRFFDNWATQLRKGMLELCILNAIKGTSLYGYDIVRRLRDIDGLVISEGTIYPILSRLKREGFVRTQIKESTEGPARKYYELTAKGEKILTQMNEYWQDIKTGTDIVKGERSHD
ncbi:MAG: PadR family transcriptional regulator [Planctomycetota bacterium]|jgi:PadR family transcriptional regulator PadR